MKRRCLLDDTWDEPVEEAYCRDNDDGTRVVIVAPNSIRWALSDHCSCMHWSLKMTRVIARASEDGAEGYREVAAMVPGTYTVVTYSPCASPLFVMVWDEMARHRINGKCSFTQPRGPVTRCGRWWFRTASPRALTGCLVDSCHSSWKLLQANVAYSSPPRRGRSFGGVALRPASAGRKGRAYCNLYLPRPRVRLHSRSC